MEGFLDFSQLSQLFTFEHLVALATLSALEIVLGIDNVVFLAILVGKLPPEQRNRARRIGLGLAMLMRIGLLFAISWVMGLTEPLFSIPQIWLSGSPLHEISGRDLILLLGGLFLVAKATWEIHDKLEGGHEGQGRAPASFGLAIVQIVLLDIVFSLDSVITAVGMVQTSKEAPWIGLTIMITAVILAVLVMLVFAASISRFVERHPTMKMLALSFLILIGVMLIVEGFEGHIPRGYIYFAMAFSLVVELLNLRLRPVSAPVAMHHTHLANPASDKPGGPGVS